MDEFTWAKREEIWPLTQYHNLFSANQSLEEALKGRIDLARKAYEYSRNNMVSNRVAQAHYLYSCAEFRRFSPDFMAFLSRARVNYRIFDDLYKYMIDNDAPPTVIEQFNHVLVYKADNKDFFDWSDERHGMLMPASDLLLNLLQSQPHALTRISGNEQQGPASAALDQPLVVVVQNHQGDPLSGITVTFAVTAGGGTLSVTTLTTDADGRASTTLALGPQPGTNSVEATVAGLEPLSFTATGLAVARSLHKPSGDEQEGAAGAALAEALVVEVRDQNGNPLAGAQVTFAVTAGSGTLSVTNATTDAHGRASTTLTLGRTPGPNTVRATAAGLEQVTFTATGLAVPRTLAKHTGDEQQAAAGAQLTEPFVVSVRDQNGAALPGAVVTFAVLGDGGTLSAAVDTTDVEGLAGTTLILGEELGIYRVEATVAGLQPVTFTATAEATPDFDGDGVTGFSDFFLFAEAFGGTDPRFDLDGSGTVDFTDFFLFAESFGQPARAKLVAMARELIGLPDGPQLRQNAPNPFNSGTVISWFQLQPGPARLEVFALTGQRGGGFARGFGEGGLPPPALGRARRSGATVSQRGLRVPAGDVGGRADPQAHLVAVRPSNRYDAHPGQAGLLAVLRGGVDSRGRRRCVAGGPDRVPD